MGQWTPNYVDNVLHAKITTLVAGAIQRAALDKSEPSITYENFVKDLDTGDSFTTTFVDILVRELAERRTRPTATDRRLIADRTAKSLRLLATPLRIYRERSSRNFSGRRAVNLSDYLSVPPNGMDMEDEEDEIDPTLDSYADGARLNQDLYEAYGFWPTRRVFSNSPSPPAEENSATMHPPSTVGRHGSWTMSNSSSSTGLRRQPSIRLSSRSRTVDFNDFTSRRRSSIREGRPEGGEGPADPRGGDVTRGPRPVTRRFFPFGRNRLHESGGTGSQDGETQSGEIADEGFTHIFEPSVPGAAWYPLTSPARSASPDHPEHTRSSAEMSDERARHLPRLRRGTIRAPESMVPYYEMRSDHPIPGSPTSEHGESRPRSAEPTAYPTPGPTENESS
ncbi:hypothetical protein AX15_007215 [Amanita polypyramis BW_CC]|nr:hypothetical protein AX15_007215 [Amanita polypyramis BW_CC]